MGIADDILRRQSTLESDRGEWESVWREAAELVMPRQADQFHGARYPDPRTDPSSPTGAHKARKIYDPSGIYALDRFAAAMESLLTPRGSKWHQLSLGDEGQEVDDEGRRWLDAVRDLMFTVRYSGRAAFSQAMGEVFRSVGAYGNAVLYVGEDFADSPISYRCRALGECYFALSHRGHVDTIHRRFRLTARQAVQQFGAERVSARVKAAADSADRTEERFQFLHAVQPRQEVGSQASGRNNMDFASYYVESESRHLVGDGGYFEFPYIDFRLQTAPDATYAEGPAMLALSDLKMLQVMARDTIRAAQKRTDPPLAVADDGVMERPNLDPGALNPGAVDAQGRMLIRPIDTGSNPGVGLEMMNARRAALQDGFYISLFQILVQNPQMTATEAMIRAQEKGELLGPAGGKLQASLSRLIDREFGIMSRKGFFDGDGILPPPESVRGRNFAVEFTSPLDRARRAEEGVGTLRTLEAMQAIAAAKPEVLDNIDADETLRGLADINGMPSKFLVPVLERDEQREAKLQAAAQAQQQAALAEAAGKAAPALKVLTDAQ